MKNRQRGSASIETALTLSVVLTVGLLASDLYMLSRARADLERSTATLATTLSSQTRLTLDGLNALVKALVAERGDTYQFYAGKVLRNGEVAWSLSMGQERGVCESPMNGSSYQGTLPERDPDADDSVALLVVRGCQSSDRLGLSSILLDGKVLQADAINRMRKADIEFDESLASLLGGQSQ